MSKPSLMPPNATATERAIEQAGTRFEDITLPHRSLWNPDTCPAELLPWLAWALSIDSWKTYWPESIKRARIRTAMEIQRKKGTAKSVRDVVQSFGSSLALREWFQTVPNGTPYTFELILTTGTNVPNTAAYQQDIVDEVSRTKPVRAHFTLTTGLAASGGIGLLAAARPFIYRRLRLEA
jgi:phage tail P2-like protein